MNKLDIEILCRDCVAFLGEQDVRFGQRPALIATDPPQNLRIDYGNGCRDDDLPRNEYLAWCSAWIDLCANWLLDDGAMWVIMSEDYVDEVGCILTESGLTRRSWVVWYEKFGVYCKKRFGRCSRHLLNYVKNPGRFTFNAEAVSVESARQRAGDKRATKPKLMDNVWCVPRVAGSHAERVKGVPTQIPLEIMRRIVGSTSNAGDLVVDPFCGSGTTGIVCAELGRRFLGIDVNETYCDIARRRLAETR